MCFGDGSRFRDKQTWTQTIEIEFCRILSCKIDSLFPNDRQGRWEFDLSRVNLTEFRMAIAANKHAEIQNETSYAFGLVFKSPSNMLLGVYAIAMIYIEAHPYHRLQTVLCSVWG